MFKTLMVSYWGQFLYAILLNIILAVILMTGPLFIDKLVNFIQYPGKTSLGLGIVYAFLFITVNFVSKILQDHITFYHKRIGFKASAGYNTLIYDKVMKLSPSAQKKYPQSRIVNQLAIDSKRVILISDDIPRSVQTPVQIIFATVSMVKILGYAYFSVALFFIGVLIFALVIGFFKKVLFTKVLKAKDKRMKVLAEMLDGIKVVKINAW